MFKEIFFCLTIATLVSCGDKDSDKKSPSVTPSVEPSRPSPGTPPLATETVVNMGEITCKDRGGFITECKFQDRVLAEKQPALTKFTFNYDFKCTGELLSLAIDFDGVIIPLKQEAGVSITLYGYGPFAIKDTDAVSTGTAYLQPGCKLEFKEFSKEAI